MTSFDPREPRALEALARLVHASVAKPSQVELERGLAALRARIAASRAGRRKRPVRAWLTAAALLCVALTTVAVTVAVFGEGSSGSNQQVKVSRIEGGRLLDGGYLSESGNAGIDLYFDEGSRFVLSPGARCRLRLETAGRARLAIEHGEATLRITQSRESRWSVEAGPFLVTVKGTDFTVFWDPASERFEVRLRHGRVVVSGPVIGDGLTLRPGQKLTVDLPLAQTMISEDRGEGTAATSSDPSASPLSSAASSPAPPFAGERSSAPPPSAQARPSAAAPERRWRDALASGEWDRILADAERDGVETTLERVSSDELFVLADAARYRRRVDLARAALLAQRRRFPSSPRSLDAIFLLGRVEELRPGGRTAALERFDEYLTRAPSGTYAAEALGRKLTLSNELEGPASARKLAEEYLRRFPEGSYAGAARALLRAR